MLLFNRRQVLAALAGTLTYAQTKDLEIAKAHFANSSPVFDRLDHVPPGVEFGPRFQAAGICGSMERKG